MASIMSSTIVNVAIPDMSQHFALGQERAQWVSSGFMVAMTVSMLTTPWLLARYGYRRTYVGAMLLLMAGGIAGGLANALSAGAGGARGRRPGRGRGAADSRHHHPARLRSPASRAAPAASSAWAWCWRRRSARASAALLVDWFGWRSIFFMVVPFCLVSLWLAFRYVPVTAPGGAAARRGAGLDWRGLLLGSAGTLCLLNGLVELHGGGPAGPLLLLAAARRVCSPSWPGSTGWVPVAASR